MSQKASAAPQATGGGAERAQEDRGEGEAEQPEAQKADVSRRTHRAKPKRGEVVDINRGGAAGCSRRPTSSPHAAGSGGAAAPSVRRMARELGVDIGQVHRQRQGGRISVEDLQQYVKGVMTGSTPAAAPARSPQARAAARLHQVGRGRAQADEQHPPQDGGAPRHAWHVDPARHAARQGRHHRARGAPQAVRSAGGEGRRQADDDGDRDQDRRRRHPRSSRSSTPRSTHGERDRLQEVGAHRRRGRHRARPARAGDPRRRPQGRSSSSSAELAKLSREGARRQAVARRDAGGVFTITNLGGIGGTSFTPIVNWPEVAILGMSRGAHEPVWDGHIVPAAPDAAAVAVLRPPRDRRRRRRALPALGVRGVRAAVHPVLCSD